LIGLGVTIALAKTGRAAEKSTVVSLDSVRITRSINACNPRRICLKSWRILGGIQTERQLDSIARFAKGIRLDTYPNTILGDAALCATKRSTSVSMTLALYWSNGVTKKVTDALACSAGTPAGAERLAHLRALRNQVETSVGW